MAMALSIDTGMQQNTNGQHVDYIEVHSEDVEAAQDGTDPAMRAVLGWAASLFPQESALNVVMTSLTEGQTKGASATVEVTFSEPVSDFSAKDLKIDDGFISNFTGSGSSYSFTLSTVEANVTASVRISANTVTDQNGNENTAAPPFYLTYVYVPRSEAASVAPSHGFFRGEDIRESQRCPRPPCPVSRVRSSAGFGQQPLPGPSMRTLYLAFGVIGRMALNISQVVS